jgi:parallel beta-helix repeat protein
VSSNEISENRGNGLWFDVDTHNVTVSNNRVHHNGQYGISALGADIVVKRNRISYNNINGFDGNWDAGGTKFLKTTNLKLLRNIVNWATNEDAPVTVIGSGVLDVTVWKQRDSMTVHLVNLTNPMMMKGPIRETCPVGAQTVSVALPDGVSRAEAKLLVADRKLEVTVGDGRASVEVPGVDLLEAVHFVWS